VGGGTDHLLLPFDCGAAALRGRAGDWGAEPAALPWRRAPAVSEGAGGLLASAARRRAAASLGSDNHRRATASVVRN
jgi:hypothetical protein